MRILGLSGLYFSSQFKQQHFPHASERQYRIHQVFDAAAALVTDEGIQAAVAEERLNGKKGSGAFPGNAIQACLRIAELTPAQIDYVAHSWSFEPYQAFFEEGDEFYRQQFYEVFSRSALLKSVHTWLPLVDWDEKLVSVPHHLAHAASAFYPSGFEEALILVADGMGEMHSLTLAVGDREGIKILKQIPASHSLGVLYSIGTLHLGFCPVSDEYKVMGLAPYGTPQRYAARMLNLVHLRDDGTFTIPLLSLNHTRDEKESYERTRQEFARLFGPPRDPSAPITQEHMDLACALQQTLQVCLFHVLRSFKRQTGLKKLCMAGGVALNCTANGLIRRSHLFEHMFVQPASGDDGSALGAALYVQREYSSFEQVSRKMTMPFWGPGYANEEILAVLQESDCTYTYFADFEALASQVAGVLEQGKVVAWFQGRMEFGPRALGNRSILADPRYPWMRDHLNRVIKKREQFRPFAPAVLAEEASTYFALSGGDDAHMLYVVPVHPAYREQLPAITHIDGSARIQVVSRESCPRFWTLLRAFARVSEFPILLNTSFNLRNQPIICTPRLALDTFLASEIDLLVIGDYLVTPLDAPTIVEHTLRKET